MQRFLAFGLLLFSGCAVPPGNAIHTLASPMGMSNVAGTTLMARADDYSHLNITRVRVASVSPVPCPGSQGGDCLRLGIVILFRQSSGTEASISTQYITGGSFISEIAQEFGTYAPMVFRLVGDALATAAQNTNPRVREAASRALPSVEAKRAYDIAVGVSLGSDLERRVARVAERFQVTTQKRLRVVGVGEASAEVSIPEMSQEDERALRAAAGETVGASVVTLTGSPPGYRLRFQPMKLTLWTSAFIPSNIPGLTRTLTAGSYSGLTAIPGPLPNNACFLTDQRGFSTDRSAKHRIRSNIELDLALSTFAPTATTDSTTEVTCDTGVKRCGARANPSGITASNFSSETTQNGDHRYFFTLAASGTNPCYLVAPQIDWRLMIVVLYDAGDRSIRVSVDGLIEPFPAFEMYASLNGLAPTMLFQSDPLPGSTPWNLSGNPNRAVTVVGKPVQ